MSNLANWIFQVVMWLVDDGWRDVKSRSISALVLGVLLFSRKLNNFEGIRFDKKVIMKIPITLLGRNGLKTNIRSKLKHLLPSLANE